MTVSTLSLACAEFPKTPPKIPRFTRFHTVRWAIFIWIPAVDADAFIVYVVKDLVPDLTHF